MAQGDSPAVARRRVRLVLRDARTALNLTQSEVAEAMEWSLSKVQRIEKGEVTVAPNDLRPLLGFLGVRDRETVEGLVLAAKVSRQRRQWWDDAHFREFVTSHMMQLAGFEADAREIFHFYPMLVPGILQTEGYAQTVMQSHNADLSRQIIERRIEFRMRRRLEFFDSRAPAATYVLLDESVVRRNLGDKAMYRAQLIDLIASAKRDHIHIRIMPFDIPESIPTMGPFEIYDLGGDSAPGELLNAVMYRESGFSDEVVDDHEKIMMHHKVFSRLWVASHDEADTLKLIEGHIGG